MLLEKLSNACGISGYEDEVRDILRRELQEHVDEMWIDTMGSLMVRKGTGPISVMLDAHMDEVGFLVGAILDDGYVKLKKVGGLDDRVLPGRQVWLTQKRIPGVIGAKAWHLTSPDERGKVIPFDQMYVDLGCKTRQEVLDLGIEPGEPVYFATTFERYSDKVVKGKAFDDRVGCTIVATILQAFSHPGLTIYGSFSVQEEVGLRGAKVAAYNLNPDLALALEGTGSANGAGVDPFDTITNLGDGPAISLMDAAGFPNLQVWEQLVKLAQESGIRYQHRRLITGGTNSGGIALQRAGIPACTIAVPCRYIHTNASLLNLDDLQGAVSLVDHFLTSLEKGDFRP
ncbi:MAG TPA: M42 family peptidase [Symbiobacteriaceae bacterium]|jgi:endoglucanase